MYPSGHARILLLLVAAMCVRAQTTVQLVQQFIQEPVFYKQFEIGKQIAAAGDKSALEQLRPLLQDSDRHVRGNAAFVIAKLGDRTGFDAIVGILNESPESRTLTPPDVYVGPTPVPTQRPLAAQLREDRYYAVHLLGELKDPAALSSLEPLLRDPALDYAVPWSLGQIGGFDAMNILIAALRHSNPEVRAFSADSLGVLRVRAALPELYLLANDETKINSGKIPTVAEYARLAIAAIEGTK